MKIKTVKTMNILIYCLILIKLSHGAVMRQPMNDNFDPIMETRPLIYPFNPLRELPPYVKPPVGSSGEPLSTSYQSVILYAGPHIPVEKSDQIEEAYPYRVYPRGPYYPYALPRFPVLPTPPTVPTQFLRNYNNNTPIISAYGFYY